ncbi:mRNA cap guanine-N7 methyltransferase [Lamellibrachia satsuma]|nr:mRNA cap guanine-N7 methyltransferase [Lamellibrachia satsuma]
MADSEAASKHEPTTDTALTNDSESAGKDGSRTDIAVTDDSKSVSKDESQTETAVTNYSKVTCLPVVDQTGKVATHYNQLKESGLEERTKSRIFYMRNFNNWIKSMAINDTISRIRKIMKPESDLSVLDLCSGKGGDLLKWRKGQIDRLVCTDIASTSVEQSEARYKEMLDRAKHERRPVKVFKADFITADCTKQRLRDMYPDPETTFDLVSCQFSFHYGFESHQQAKQMIQNACECLRPGGYFLGTTPDSNELVKRLRASDDMSFGNEVYSVGFETEDKTQLPLFGAKYNFHLEGVVDCPEFLVHFPLVEKMAAEYGMKLVYKKPFAEFFDEHIRKGDGRGLIGRMQCLEPFPPDEDVELMGKKQDNYSHVRSYLGAHQNDRHDGRPFTNMKVGTLSKDEWEAVTIYLVFAFQKVGDATTDTGPTSPKHTPARKRPVTDPDDNTEPSTKQTRTLT